MEEQATKTCFKCGETKPLPLFYKHPKMADGYVNKCKECNKLDVIKNKRKNQDYYLNYDRERSKTVARKEAAVKYAAVTRSRHAYKKKANNAVLLAIKSGILNRPCNCEYCGSDSKIEAHHSVYTKDMWLSVTWLCTICHGNVHRKYDF